MFGFLKEVFDPAAADLRRYRALVEKINRQEEKIKALTDSQLKAKTREFQAALKGLKDKEREGRLASFLPEAFAVVREAAQRTRVGLRHFDVQLMAAAALFEGRAVEQKTGEGKTLSATPALYLRALAGKGAHLVTVNDYLARRDAGWMGPIFHFLGLSVGCIIHEQSFLFDPQFVADADDERLSHLRPVSRQEAYRADITYGTNNEFGFDYLRDNMVLSLDDKVQRGHYFAIVDEVDFALIDEARTPLIISSPEAEPTDKYLQFVALARSLVKDVDYKVDEESQSVALTDHGITKVEKKLNIENLYQGDFDTVHHLENALKAKELYRRDREYVVKDNQVIIVDEFTGRLMFGRRWSAGLHQAVEAKEGVPIKKESKTLATISFQNYFRLYQVLSGMTGTAYTSKEEFKKIYRLETVVIPTNRPLVRKDYPDAVFKNQRAKYAAVAEKVAQLHQKGRPVLVGTTSIEKNEIVSQLLRHKGIPHHVLNAKNHEKEALVIAQAGKKGAVTVATNMAGRGVDIVLGGEPPKKPKGKAEASAYQKKYEKWQKEHDEVISLGGLHVIGTERHEARRIDDQLRGRAGRQGDPGSSQFYVALDDDMMRIFGGDRIAALMSRFNLPEDMPIENSLISRSIEQIQAKVEGVNFDARRYLVEYDDVLNKQREIIYRIRDRILGQIKEGDKKGLLSVIWQKAEEQAGGITARYFPEEGKPDESDYQAMAADFLMIVPLEKEEYLKLEKEIVGLPKEKVNAIFYDQLKKFFAQWQGEQKKELLIILIKLVFLGTIDRLWMAHLDEIESLREGINLRAYGQQDPLVAYKNEAFAAFERLMARLDGEIAGRIFRVKFEKMADLPQSQTQRMVTNIDTSDGMGLVDNSFSQGQRKIKPVVSGQPHPGRNDPCPCGSGKKYKNCCYPKYG